MNSRMRALFFGFLTVVLAPFALPDRAEAPEADSPPALGQVPIRPEAHPATGAARGLLPVRHAERLPGAPFVPEPAAAMPTAPEVPAVGVPQSAAFIAAAAILLLPPSRAPPELS
jgi:hypothetical protein